MSISAGELRSIIEIQEKTLAAMNEYGEKTPIWAAYAANVRCKIVHVSGQEVVMSGAEKSRARIKFLMRYLSGVDESMRIVDSAGKIFGIISINNINDLNQDLKFLVQAWVDEG